MLNKCAPEIEIEKEIDNNKEYRVKKDIELEQEKRKDLLM